MSSSRIQPKTDQADTEQQAPAQQTNEQGTSQPESIAERQVKERAMGILRSDEMLQRYALANDLVSLFSVVRYVKNVSACGQTDANVCWELVRAQGQSILREGDVRFRSRTCDQELVSVRLRHSCWSRIPVDDGQGAAATRCGI